MVTVADVARHVSGITDMDSDIALVGKWVSQRWIEIANTASTLRTLRREALVTVPAKFDDGTVSVTQGDAIVTGTDTNWTQKLVGRYFRVSDAWYRIVSVADPLSLRLESLYAETTAADVSYEVIDRKIRLVPSIRKIGVFRSFKYNRPLRIASQEGMDLARPGRRFSSGIPVYVTEMEPDTDGVKRVEIYPYPSEESIFSYTYWAEPGDLGFRDEVPSFIDMEALREGVLIDVMRHLQFKAAKSGDVNLAGFYRNEARAQETSWNQRHRGRILIQDFAIDDMEILLMESGAHPDGNALENIGIVDAYTQVWLG